MRYIVLHDFATVLRQFPNNARVLRWLMAPGVVLDLPFHFPPVPSGDDGGDG